MRCSPRPIVAFIVLLTSLQLPNDTAHAQTRASAAQDAAAHAFVASLVLADHDERVEHLRAKNRGLLLPGLTIALGVSMMVIGGVVFARAWSASVDDYDVAKDRAGLVLMPSGAVITLVGIPLFATRLSRTLRLRHAEGARERFVDSLRMSVGRSAGALSLTLHGSL